MKNSTFKICFYLLAWLCAVSPAYADSSNWADVLKTEKLTIQAEDTLYTQKDNPNFFIHVRIQNKTDNLLGVELRKAWRTVYPNQWQMTDRDQRSVIDEITLLPERLDSVKKRDLRIDFRFERLGIVAIGKAIDYYVNFNGSGREELTGAVGKNLIISLKGQMFFSDGEDAWDENANFDLVIPKPLRWRKIPKNAIVILH